MTPLESISISGFRGILTTLQLSFVKGGTPTSMVIYGRNGTGKSSITDAWEWFHAGKIERLGREGAGPDAYPHKDAGDTVVEVRFRDVNLDPIKLRFDPQRITLPVEEGPLGDFRDMVTHPCHVRFEDLTRFVLLTKAERYEALARLMGFVPQVELQKGLRRTLRKLDKRRSKVEDETARVTSQLKEHLEVDTVDDAAFLEKLNTVLVRQGLDTAPSMEDLEAASRTLRSRVEADPRAKEISNLATLKRALEAASVRENTWSEVSRYADDSEQFKEREGEAVDVLLIDLYTAGQKLLDRRVDEGSETDRCPLCKQHVDRTELHQHIADELEELRELKQARDNLDSRRREVREEVRVVDSLAKRFNERCSELDLPVDQWPIPELIQSANTVGAALGPVVAFLETSPEHLTREQLQTISGVVDSLDEATRSFEEKRAGLEATVRGRQNELERDDSRSRLVNDHEFVRTAFETRNRLREAREKHDRIAAVHSPFEAVVEAFIASSTEDVRRRFDLVSSDLSRYFAVLEEDTTWLGNPAIRLIEERDRAVMLEVEFRGEPISPAYRYLSESQLNSFGLAVFLASAKRSNPEFPFLLLDDVINSFDGYKRPKVIRLLKEEFPDHQILVLTHDEVWTQKLFEEFPGWVRQRFVRFEGTGPVIQEGRSDLEKVEDHLSNDEATDAGQHLGPLLERQFQELGQAFEILVKYEQRNAYTLQHLLERFRVRVKEKLGEAHPLTITVEELESEQGFRNLCAHWKNPSIPLTCGEIQTVVDAWKTIEEIVRCAGKTCYGFVRYDGSRSFMCPCGATVLERQREEPA